jgi:hypothetical protein
MYRECWVAADQVLTLGCVVMALFILGLIAALERQTLSARKWRKLFGETAEENRMLRRERSWSPPSFSIPNHSPTYGDEE